MRTCIISHKTATFYFIIIWYSLLFNFLLNNNEQNRQLIMGTSIHILPLLLISHYVLYYSDLYTKCMKKISLQNYILNDIIFHYIPLIIYIILFNKINKRTSINSPFLLIGFFSILATLLIYGFIMGFDNNIYTVSFYKLGVCWLILSTLILFAITA